jgi:DNA-binding CsgD family transcriptional regulator
VFEDVHWADEATLDLLRFLGRRISQTCTLLVMTFRDDELGTQHPLRIVLGDLPISRSAQRISLKPLSEDGVRALAGEQSIDVHELHSKTGGNPFYITEILTNSTVEIPLTIRDAVLARAARLSPSAEAVLQAAAIIGTRIEPWLLAEVTGAEVIFIEECMAVGVLQSLGDVIAFRHELTRQTILDTISAQRSLVLHRLVLDALASQPATRHDLARLAHHASAAGDRDGVLKFAAAAALQASTAGAHRAAASLYGLTLHYAQDLDPDEHAVLLEAYAWESNLINQQSEAIVSRRRAIDLWRQVGNPIKEGENLALLTMALLGNGQPREAEQSSLAAIEILENQAPGKELALAYRNQAFLENRNHNINRANILAEKAVALAERYGDARVLAMAYDTLGSNLLSVDFERGSEYLQRCLGIAREARLDARVATVYANLGSAACELYHFETAERYLSEGMTYCAERDLDLVRLYMLAWHSFALFYRGQWQDAESASSMVMEQTNISPHSRLPALVVMGRLQARQGVSGSHEILTQVLESGAHSNHFEDEAPLHAALAEVSWLQGNHEQALNAAQTLFKMAVDKQHPWLAGEAAFWLWQCRKQPTLYDWMASPFLLQIAGDWQAASEEWERLACPYEQARALAAGDSSAQMRALRIFERLGARPWIDAVRQNLQSAGIKNVPASPRHSTRENPFGLTGRQLEILVLLIEGLSNTEISARLHISPKTADHHVSAILAKMELHSREEAARLAQAHPYFSKK